MLAIELSVEFLAIFSIFLQSVYFLFDILMKYVILVSQKPFSFLNLRKNKFSASVHYLKMRLNSISNCVSNSTHISRLNMHKYAQENI